MTERIRRQLEYKVRKKLVKMNIKRVLYSSVICACIIPVMMLIYKLNPAVGELSGTISGLLITFECVNVIYAVLSVLSIKSQDDGILTLGYRSYWVLFELFSFVIIYSDILEGKSLTWYSIMLAALLLVPAMNLNESLYYIVIQMVYVVFLSIKFEFGVKSLLDIAILNGVIITVSRLIYRMQLERMTLKDKIKEIMECADTDALTKLYNRKGLEKCVYSSVKVCIRERRRISVLMIDIDDLSKYNNDFGCARGDECIVTLANLIKQVVLRNTDILCRLDGGKFLVYMEGGNDMEPVTLAEKVRSCVERKRIPQSRSSSNPFMSISIGVASVIPKSESDFSEIYDEAEDSLYEAKERGKNMTVYDEQIYGRSIRKAN